MKQQIPSPLYRKILFTGLIGAGCMLFGIVYYFSAKDRILLLLSLLVLCCCAWKAWSIYRIAKQNKYELVEGTCVGVTQKIIGKFQTVKMMDEAGVESTLRLSKNCKLKIGDKYRLYFSQREHVRTGYNYFDTALMTDSFLGYEHVLNDDSDHKL